MVLKRGRQDLEQPGHQPDRPGGGSAKMAQQIRIERKPMSTRSQQAKQDAQALDLRTPSGKKLPY